METKKAIDEFAKDPKVKDVIEKKKMEGLREDFKEMLGEDVDTDWAKGFITDKYGNAKPQYVENPRLALSNDPRTKGAIQKNKIDDRIYITKDICFPNGVIVKAGAQLNDTGVKQICHLLEVTYGLTNPQKIVDAIDLVSEQDSFHPFQLYIDQLRQLPLTLGVIDQVLACLELEADHHPDYKQRIIKKWFGGIMGTLMGSYCIMSLVIVGGQNGGKTTFFRNLLPVLLKELFAETDLKDDKDCFEIMCTKLIVYDDEFTSATKIESSIRKKITSAEYFDFRKPYARLVEHRKRIAVPCGSANDHDVVSDFTGNRRVIPARTVKINLVKFEKINLDLFYRELLYLHDLDPVWWHLSAKDILFMNKDTLQNTVTDPFEEQIRLYTIADPEGHVSASGVESHLAACNKSFRPNSAKLGRALTRVYGNSTLKKIDAKGVRGYPLKLVFTSEFALNVERELEDAL